MHPGSDGPSLARLSLDKLFLLLSCELRCFGFACSNLLLCSGVLFSLDTSLIKASESIETQLTNRTSWKRNGRAKAEGIGNWGFPCLFYLLMPETDGIRTLVGSLNGTPPVVGPLVSGTQVHHAWAGWTVNTLAMALYGNLFLFFGASLEENAKTSTGHVFSNYIAVSEQLQYRDSYTMVFDFYLFWKTEEISIE